MERRLVAILAADVVGYSKLMAQDEEGTLETLRTHRAKVFDPAVAAHNGRIIKLMGDGTLVEFASVVDAVNCALAIQSQSAESGAAIRLRIGINVGDVIVENDDIYGDGVNIAARLEGLAEPDGICVSRNVFEQVNAKVRASFEYAGEKQVKNIPEPVHAYRALLGGIPSSDNIETRSRFQVNRRVMAAGLVAVAIFAGGAAWYSFSKSDEKSAVLASEADPLPDRPSIAVLPFDNMSGDRSQDYFADGMTEDLITDLSKISGLLVIARNSSFSYKDKQILVRQVAEELGVRYVLEGSVRRVGEQVRINAQLIDAATEGHLWAERYDGSLTDVFSLQDKVTARIIEALKVQLTPKESQAVDARGTDQIAAYDAFLRGMEILSSRRAFEASENRLARDAFSEAVQIDPEYALGYAGLAWANWLQYSIVNYYQTETRHLAFEYAEKSLSLDKNALAYRALAKKHFTLDSIIPRGESPDLALSFLEAAEKLEPNNPDVLADLAEVLPFVGRPKEAFRKITQAIELNPKHPDWYLRPYAIALFLAGRFEQAAGKFEALLTASRISKEYYVWLAAAWALAGQPDHAKQILKDKKIVGATSVAQTIYAIKRRWPLAADEREILVRGLRLAGLPD